MREQHLGRMIKAPFSATAVLVLAWLFGVQASAQMQQADLTRTKYELNVVYDDAIGYSESVCPLGADDWSNLVNWGDNTGNTKATADAKWVKNSSGAYVVSKGRYNIFAIHSYQQLGHYNVVILNNIHCFSGAGGVITRQFKSVATVFPRVAVESIDVNKEYPLRSGRPIEVRVLLKVKAPESGTRVFLNCNKPQVIDSAYPLPKYVDVAAQQDLARVTFRPIQGLSRPTTLTITATAGGQPQSVTFTVAP